MITVRQNDTIQKKREINGEVNTNKTLDYTRSRLVYSVSTSDATSNNTTTITTTTPVSYSYVVYTYTCALCL